MAVAIDKMIFGKGSGNSKKKAEQAAAKEALEKLVR
jgi:dsRNA-specific ribonuclease